MTDPADAAPMPVFMNTIITGTAAIAYAEQHGGLTLNKYSDPIEDARIGLSVDEAEDIARIDPSLIWIESAELKSYVDARLRPDGTLEVLDRTADQEPGW